LIESSLKDLIYLAAESILDGLEILINTFY